MNKQIPEEIRIRKLKNIFDKLFAVILFIFSAPIFLIVAIINKINGFLFPGDKGAVLFKIERISQGEKILLFKFRTVKQTILDEILEKEGRIDDIKPLEKDNKNLTWLGKYLKDFYLDELPQLLNILKGQISFVGPRPYPVNMYRAEIAQRIYRKKVIRAGLTGLVQVNKEKVKSKKEEIGLDLEYIQKFRTLSSFKLLCYDLGIIFRSLIIVLKGQGL